jgi:hypothetical protein
MVGLMACDDSFLERYPLDSMTPETYFLSENEFKYYSNGFYAILPTAVGIYGETADNIANYTLAEDISGTRQPRGTDSQWTWGELRRINFLMKYSKNCPDENIRLKYEALARFFRAAFYFNKLKRFGEVPWYNEVIEDNDYDNLMKPRTPRAVLVDSILQDINIAIKNIDKTKNVERVHVYTALALKSRICLYEGTFRKYHTEFNLPNADYFLQECVAASEILMSEGGYKIYNKTTGPTGKPYQDLFASMDSDVEEIILTRRYSSSLQVRHNLNFYLVASTQGKPGLEKKLVNSYLMRNGDRFTDKPGYETMIFADEVKDRDPRLEQTIRVPGYTRIGQTAKLAPDFNATVTGYQLIKFFTTPEYDASSSSSNDIPILRYAEILLNYVEAKAELGTLQQVDLDKSIKLIRDRVGMSNINKDAANANPDPYLEAQYRNVSGANKGVILEIRRERRIEMVMENLRWDDLMRWKEGHLLAESFRGMYFPGVGEYNLDNNGAVDIIVYAGEKPETNTYCMPVSQLSEGTKGYVEVHKGIVKTFNEDRDYFWPIPIEQRKLNPNLTQNPGWDDGLDY